MAMEAVPDAAGNTPGKVACLLEMHQVSKRFPGVHALDRVSLEVRAGEIHALVGENGAGKSTLMKVLAGILSPDSGRILLQGREVSINSPRRARALGISMIHQELALIPYLTVGQNIYLGREPLGRLGLIDWKLLYQQAREQLEKLGLELKPRRRVAELPLAQQQMVEVAKALSFKASIIIMDEPTSSLSEGETETLFRVMRGLKEQGITIIYISHRLEEIFAATDRVTVLRDGHFIGTYPIRETRPPQVVRLMVGRDLGAMYSKRARPSQRIVLQVRDLSAGEEFQEINFDLHRGEILGLAGLIGAGRTALARCLFGVDPLQGGRIWIEGQEARIDSPGRALRLGLGFVPEDRQAQGLFLGMGVRENITIGLLAGRFPFGFLRFRELNLLAEGFIRRLDIRTPHLSQKVSHLSGGNQQKVVIARWLTLNPKILILDEPTRGIDVGAKAEIHALMDQLAGQGVGILMISSELPEILGISDRILVMREGRIAAKLNAREASQDTIMHYAAEGSEGP